MRAIWPGALVSVYLFATLMLMLVGRARVSVGGVAIHAAFLVIVVVSTWSPVVPRWIRAWMPLLMLLALYSEIPMLLRAAGHTGYYDGTVIGWEQILFHAQPAIAWARALPDATLSEVLHLAYLSYYPIIFATPFVLYRAHRDMEFSECVFVLMCTFVVCCVAYLIVPVAGPRYQWPSTNTGGLVRPFTLWLLETRSSRGTAFPSSHVAISVTQAALSMRYFGRRGSVVAVLALLLAVGAVYGGFHYAVDVIAGGLTGILCTSVGLAAFRLTGPVAVLQGEGDRADISAAGVVDAS
jgi:membrane-associated phospholipid phosphatase